MDYETFGEHQWAETGIFDFLKAFPKVILSTTDFKFNTPYELSKELQPVSPISVPYPISWADEERDVTAWLGNELQTEAFTQLFALEEKVKECNDGSIKRDWHRLQNSDHLYYMCTKWFSDGEVHKYFNPYNSPYDAFINYMNVVSDFSIRVNEVFNANPIPDMVKPVVEVIVKPEEISKPKKVVAVKVKAKAKKKTTKSKKTSVAKTAVAKKQKIKDEALTFDKIIELPDFIIKELTKTVKISTLSNALKNADEEFKDTLLSFLGIRKLNAFEEEISKIDKITTNDIQKARKAILEIAENLIHKKK